MTFESDDSLRRRLTYITGVPVLASGEALDFLASKYGLQRQTNQTDIWERLSYKSRLSARI